MALRNYRLLAATKATAGPEQRAPSFTVRGVLPISFDLLAGGCDVQHRCDVLGYPSNARLYNHNHT